MLTIEIFDKLKKSETSSWAVWEENNNNDLKFFCSKLHILHGKTVFVGLNRSNIATNSSKVDPFKNFHKKGHVGDKRLRKLIQDAQLSNLIGGFMTDLSEQIETKSNCVKIEEQESVEKFTKKVQLIDNSKIRHIICFGDKVFNTFINGFKISKTRIKEISENKIREVDITIKEEVWCKEEVWSLYRVWHYSNFGKYLHKSKIELPDQLNYINNRVGVE